MLASVALLEVTVDQGNAQDEANQSRLRGVPVLPFRAGRHLTAWIIWHTARVSLLSDHTAPQPPDERRSTRTGRAA
jgi:hypothetical protein